ncbi:serine/threonine-protein kinase [Streptomyces parvus]
MPDAARWGAQICDALAEAHTAGVMHRDIKPSNILIMPSGFVKVLDFGIARAVDPYATADRLTEPGFIVGTPPYMAPEQARGLPEPRSDLYAVGCLLFELITGRLPFQAPDAMGYLSAHLTQQPPSPSSVRAGIPPVWDDLVLTLLSKDPEQRYPNAARVSQVLRQFERTPEPVSPAGHEARRILTARMDRAMRASLARRADLSRNAGQKDTVVRTPPQVETTVQYPPTVPFEVSWTGQEPLSTYAAGPGHEIFWLMSLLSAAISAGSFFLLADLGFETPESTAGTKLLQILSVLGLIGGGAVAFLTAAAAIGITHQIGKHGRERKARSRWSLHVGGQGITTHSSAGRREIPWQQIQRVSVERIQSSSPFRFTGIHIDPEHGAGKPVKLRPAGWPYSRRTLTARTRRPVCVLGPLTKKQRKELKKALAGYGGQRWVTRAHFTTDSVDP